VCAQNIAQGGVHQVRRRMVALDVLPSSSVCHNGHTIAHPQRLLGVHAMRHEPGHGIIRAAHFRQFQRTFVIP
jgi:hypothetical protein